MERLSTPEKISEYMRGNIHYATPSDRKKSQTKGCWWKTPEETFNDRFGFCYDLAAFALYGLVKHAQPNSKLLFTRWGNWGRESNSGHFVAVYGKDGAYHSIDNGRLKGPFNSLDQLLMSTARNNKIKHSCFFSYDSLPFHMPYNEMMIFG